MIKAVFFDAAGTLIHLRKSVGEHYATIAAAQGAEISPGALDRAFLQAWNQMPTRAAIARERPDDDKGWWRDLVNRILVECPGVPRTLNGEDFFEAAYQHFAEPGVWALYPDVKPVLAQLATAFQLNIISNFDRRLHPIIEQLGIAHFFAHIFTSSRLGADKPDSKIYRRALKMSGFRAEEVIHVGDDEERDWQAAADAGLGVFKLDRPRNSLWELLGLLSNGGDALLRGMK